jgi:single-strand DNA-binding protein
MAKGVNRVTLIGNLGADPEVKFTQNGNAVSNLRLACNERKKEGDNWVDHTEWVDIVVFGKTAENCAQYLAKGRQVYVEGRLQTRKWQDKAGNPRYKTEVVANTVNFLSGEKRADSSNASTGASVAPPSNGYNAAQPADNDLPF